MDYKSARLIGASGKLQKNKGVMLVGASGENCQLQFKGLSAGTTILGLNGLSGGNWVNSQASVVIQSSPQNPVIIVPVQVYGITLGSAAVFELN